MTGDNPIPKKLGEASPIKHVIYIIKENRTYDQVFGDIKEGNGTHNCVCSRKRSLPTIINWPVSSCCSTIFTSMAK